MKLKSTIKTNFHQLKKVQSIDHAVKVGVIFKNPVDLRYIFNKINVIVFEYFSIIIFQYTRWTVFSSVSTRYTPVRRVNHNQINALVRQLRENIKAVCIDNAVYVLLHLDLLPFLKESGIFFGRFVDNFSIGNDFFRNCRRSFFCGIDSLIEFIIDGTCHGSADLT